MPILTLSSTVPPVGTAGGAGTFAHVGTDVDSSFASHTQVTTLKFTSLNVGDLVVVIAGGGNGSAAAVATSMGSPNTTGWQLVTGPTFDPTFGGGPAIWIGQVVNPTVNDVLTVTWGANSSTTYLTIVQFHPTVTLAPPLYTVDKIGATNATGTAITWPSLTPTGTGELYFGACAQAGTPSGGATAGYTYGTDAATNQYLYNPSIAAITTPASAQSPSATYETIAALIRVFASTLTLNTQTVTLQQVPAGRQWIVSQIGYEILPLYTPGTGVAQPTVNVTMNQRALYNGVNGNGGSNQGPPYIAVKPGDNLTVTWTNAPVGASCIANFFYTEYDANVTASEIGNVV